MEISNEKLTADNWGFSPETLFAIKIDLLFNAFLSASSFKKKIFQSGYDAEKIRVF